MYSQSGPEYGLWAILEDRATQRQPRECGHTRMSHVLKFHRLALLTIIISVMTLVTLARSRIRHMQTNQALLPHSVPRPPRQSITLIFRGYQAKRLRTAPITLHIYNFLIRFFFFYQRMHLPRRRPPGAFELPGPWSSGNRCP